MSARPQPAPMMRTLIDLTETLDNTFPLEWQTQGDGYWYGTFDVGDERYCVSITAEKGFEHADDPSQDGEWYDLAFGLERDSFAGSRVIDTDGMAFRIFGTAIAAFEEFIDTVQPEFIMLSASKENPNRIRLYRRMARRFSADLASRGYHECPAPRHRYANTTKYFDSLAWRRSAEATV